jgi:hypothetical protein
MKSYLVTKFGFSLVSAERAAKARSHARTSWTVRFAPQMTPEENHLFAILAGLRARVAWKA